MLLQIRHNYHCHWHSVQLDKNSSRTCTRCVCIKLCRAPANSIRFFGLSVACQQFSLVGEQQKGSTSGPLFALSCLQLKTLSPPLSTGQFAKRKKTSLWFTVALLVVSTFILTIGLAATTRTENVTVGGYYPGIIVSKETYLRILGTTK